MSTDAISDLLIRLKNGRVTGQEKIVVPYSKLKSAVLTILQKEGVVGDVAEKVMRGRKVLEVRFSADFMNQIFPEFVRVSKPGRRIYIKARDIPRPLRGYGLVVLSTPQGLMTGREAKRKGVGGEILFRER